MFWFLLLAVLNYGLVPVFEPLLQGTGERSYQNREIATALGIVFVLSSVTAMLLTTSSTTLFPSTLLFFGLLGLIDDLLGNGAKGIKGHFRTAQITTGMLKAVAGVLFSLAAARTFSSGWLDTIINALLIAVGANFINLLDLRPGRAGKVFLLASLVLILLAPRETPLLLIVGAVLGYLPWDLRGTVMMGDAGANPLGAILGLAAAFILAKWARIILAALLLGITLWAEKGSISKLIESNRFLNFLDQLGR